jgi:alkyl hydroperoxide reductase subunit AhpC
LEKFKALNTQVLGVSVDSIPSHEAWAESLGGITYPLLSDFWPHGEIAQKFGVLTDDGFCDRVIFIIDKQGIIRYIDHHDIDDTPDNEDLFKVLREMQ